MTVILVDDCQTVFGMPLSKSQVVNLGKRLRDAEIPSNEDLQLLAEVLLEYNRALDTVTAGLSSLGLEPTTRLKTSGTIIDKLRRSDHLTLRSIRDLAGARIVKAMTFDEQDQLASEIIALWPGSQLVDRRMNPSHGYRALHVVPRIGHCSVEVQLRTFYQDTWAQAMEIYGDAWGRAIRYGGEPDEPDKVVLPDRELTRRDVIEAWKGTGDSLYELGKLENELAQSRKTLESPERDLGEAGRELLAQNNALALKVEEQFNELRGGMNAIREIFQKQRSS